MLKELNNGLVEVTKFNGSVLLGLSVGNVALSLLLTPEEARTISGVLFSEVCHLIMERPLN